MRYSADVLMRLGVGIRARICGPLADKLWQTQVARAGTCPLLTQQRLRPAQLVHTSDLPFSHPLRIRPMWRA